MSSKKAEKILLALLIVVGISSLIGVTILIGQAKSIELAIFELLAFGISVIAVLLAVIGAITSVQQTRSMRKIAHDIKETIHGLQGLDADTESIKRKLQQDYSIAKDIAEALADAGIMVNDHKDRKNLAEHIEKKFKKT